MRPTVVFDEQHACGNPREGATGWFDGTEVLPTRPGVYECEWGGEWAGVYFNHFDGIRWRLGHAYLAAAGGNRLLDPVNFKTHLIRWRGLTASVHKRLTAQLS
jgi:hypothetical protein